MMKFVAGSSLVAALVVGAAFFGMSSPLRADPLEAPPACKPVAASAKVTVTFGDVVTLRELAVWMEGLTCQPIVFASELAVKALEVNVVGGKAMSVKQARAVFDAAMQAVGLVARSKDGVMTIVRDPKAPCADAVSLAPISSLTEDARKAHGIVASSETRFTIKRAMFEKLVADAETIAKGARIVPSVKDGKSNGLKLFAIRPGSLHAALGFLNGDTVVSWDGAALTSIEVVMTKYATLRTAKRIELGVIRRGADLTLVYDITD